MIRSFSFEVWLRFWRNILLACGVLFLVAALIFFIAWNWTDMHRFTRLGLVQGAVLLPGLAALLFRFGGAPGRAALLACGLCVGPMLAVFGQTYQTGAELWTLFFTWALFLTALAIIGAQSGLFLSAWLTAGLAAILYMGHDISEPHQVFLLFTKLPEYLLAQAALLAAWEAAGHFARKKYPETPEIISWAHARWLPRLWGASLIGALGFALSVSIISVKAYPVPMLYIPPANWFYWSLFVVCLAGGWLWYRKNCPDLFMLACGIAGIAVIFVSLLFKAEIFITLDVFSLFAWGGIIIGVTWSCLKILLHLQKSMALEAADKKWAGAAASFDFAKLIPPWYALAISAFGGWLAALFFIAALALFVYLMIGIYRVDAALLFCSLPLLFVGILGMRSKSVFARQFGLSLALGGTGAAMAGLVILIGDYAYWPLAAVLPPALALIFVRDAIYSFLTLCVMAILPAIYFGLIALRGIDHDILGSGYYLGFVLSLIWWLGLALTSMHLIHLYEKKRLKKEKENCGEGYNYLSLASGIHAGMMLFAVMALVYPLAPRYSGVLLMSVPLGLGVGIAFFYLTWILAREQENNKIRLILLAHGALALPLGWFLPGAALASLGIGISNLINSKWLARVSGFFLFAYLVYFYYALNVPLSRKSLILAVVGLVLLAGGLCFKFCIKNFFADEFKFSEQEIKTPNLDLSLRQRSCPSGLPVCFWGNKRIIRFFIFAVLIILLIGFNFSIVQKENLRSSGIKILLPLLPRDPRALLMGDYMALNFELSEKIRGALYEKYSKEFTWDKIEFKKYFSGHKSGLAIIRLEEFDKYALPPKFQAQKALFARLDDGGPLGAGEHYILYQIKGGNVSVGASAFYFQEGRAEDYERARYGLICLGKDGQTLLMDLYTP